MDRQPFSIHKIINNKKGSKEKEKRNERTENLMLVIFGLAVAITTTILTMIYGWGLEPQSWWWIIGMSLFGHIFAQIILAIAESD
ncbi:MAG: hypothetical protein ACOCWG_00730 [bacterium]